MTGLEKLRKKITAWRIERVESRIKRSWRKKMDWRRGEEYKTFVFDKIIKIILKLVKVILKLVEMLKIYWYYVCDHCRKAPHIYRGTSDEFLNSFPIIYREQFYFAGI